MPPDLRRLREALGDRYLIEEELGRGGMATVYRAEDLRHGRRVALKVIHPTLVDEVGRERFLREIQIAAKLSHPHIHPLLDSGEADGLLFYVMAVADGDTLARRLDSTEPVAVGEAVRLGREIAEALAYAHAHGVVHRDVKPANVLLEAGHAVLTDFGIARSTAATAAGRLTATGVTLGTAEYMSPEQCSGDAEVDERSDVYSLGCVLHHMLAGRPPFTGRSTAAVVAQQLRDAPPPLRSLRPDVPPWLQATVLRALEKDPARRHPSAQALGEELSQGTPSSLSPVPWPSMRLAGAVMGGVVALALLVAVWMERAPVPPLDPSRFAVLSFVQLDSARVHLVDGSRCQTRLREALARWEDVALVPATVLRDRELRRNGRPLRGADALAIAQEVGAGRLVWGQVWQEGDTTRVEANLYDVATGAVLRSHRVALGPSDPMAETFDAMADSLIVGQVTATGARAGAGGTRSLDALRLYDDGHRSLGRWELEDAARAFGAAADRDPGYAHASLWRSLVGLFQGEEYGAWRAYAARAAQESEALSARERLLARGLGELASSRWQEACGYFSQAVSRDSLSFEAWLGLGDCQARDPAVEADPGSPSGWRFRSSYASAGRAYLRALELAPSYAFVLQDTTEHQLERVFPLRLGDARVGFADGVDPTGLWAVPELRDDTLAYDPWPLEEFLVRHPTPGMLQAVQANQVRLSQVSRAWLQAFPGDPTALATHARMLETRGMVAPTGDPTTSALDAVAAARRLPWAGSAESRLQVTALHLRLLLKSERPQAVRSLADTLLASGGPEGEATADVLAGTALLRGRASEAARIMASVAPEVHFPFLASQERAPVPLRETALRFAAYAAAGGPVDSLRALRDRALRQGADLVPVADRVPVLSALLSDDMALAYTAVAPGPDDPPPNPGNPIAGMLLLAAGGDTAGARRALEASAGLSSALAEGGIPISLVWMESQVRLALGDTAATVAQLDRALGSLRTHDALLTTMTQTGPLLRSMALRADLAAAAGDTLTARRWAAMVSTLWGDGEEPARGVAARMRALLPRDSTPLPPQEYP